jgi:2-methylcitrate dehydratase PrpD
VKAMIERIDFGVNDEAERAGFDKMTTIIDVELKDGRTLSTRADFGKGSPANPMSYDEVAEKFRGCCDFARVPKKTAEEIVAMVRDLESLPAISKLTALLMRAG